MSYLLAIFSVLLLGDFREVIKTTSDCHVSVLTVYRRRGGIRAENQGSHSPFHRVTIQNAQQKTTYMLDLESNQYVEFIPRPTGFILTLATWIARSPAVVESHKLSIYISRPLIPGNAKSSSDKPPATCWYVNGSLPNQVPAESLMKRKKRGGTLSLESQRRSTGLPALTAPLELTTPVTTT